MVGTARGLETKLVPEAGFRLELVHAGQLKNVSLATRAKTAFDLPRGIFRCISLLRSFRPHVVIGVGGYASGPAMLAALLLRVPMMAYEPNAVPGLANRLIGKHVDAAAVNFEQTRNFFRNAEVTGVPVREAFFSLPERVADASQHLLVFGGSLGARARFCIKRGRSMRSRRRRLTLRAARIRRDGRYELFSTTCRRGSRMRI